MKKQELMRLLAQERKENARIRTLYHNLLWEVDQKVPGETLHETAKRLLREAQGHSELEAQDALQENWRKAP